MHAVLLMEDAQVPREIIEEVNGKLADHQRITGHTVWPQEDFPRTHTLKVKKTVVRDYLMETDSPSSETASAPPETTTAAQTDPLISLISQIAQVPDSMVDADKLLYGDLGLDSLSAVELLSVIERDLGVYIDESFLSPATTVSELRDLVAEQPQAPAASLRFVRWPFSTWCINLRAAIHHGLLFPWLGTRYRANTTGLENLTGLKGPVLFAINHNAIQWDSLLFLKILPRRWRRHVAYAAAAEIVFTRGWFGFLASLVGNAFPLSRDSAIRPSLEYMGSLFDSNWSVGIFPEGIQFVGEEMKPFQSGIGLLAVECRIPVVPVRLVNQGRSRQGALGSPESVSIRIGSPLVFPPTTDWAEATERIEDAVRSL